MGKPKCPADELAETDLTHCRRRWTDDLAPEILADLEEIRRRWQAGSYAGKTIKAIFEWCRTRFGLSVCRITFERWLKGEK